MLRLSEVAVDLGGFALRVDSLELAPGEYLVILGHNGAGKTVLLETIAGLHPVKKGRVEFREAGAEPERPGDAWMNVTTWPPEKRQVGFVYQDYLLFPHLSVSDNIGFGLKGRVPAPARVERVREAAKLTGVEGLLGRRVAGLSGGEQQKVALARALAIRPRLLLLDEPLAALDRSARRGMADEVRGLCRELGVTVLHVTHSLDEAIALGDRVAVLAGGGLLQIGSPEELLRAPANRRVAELMGCENLLEGSLTGSTVAIAGGPTLVVGGNREREMAGEVVVALRAEDLSLQAPSALDAPSGAQSAVPCPNLFTAVVETVEAGPAHWTVKVRYAGEAQPSPAGGDPSHAPAQTFTIFVMPPELSRLALTLGAPVHVHVEPQRIRICPP
jgi:ABC-type Fe3+/spermidine/putrescine transport system ATPase subunit